MSQESSGFTGAQHPHGTMQGPVGPGYIPTEDEKRVFRECNQESFWYRSLPLSAVAVTVTQVLVSRGVIAPSPRFGSWPKVIIAGMIGYMGGKISYMKICQEKFKNLENSPLGEALRRGKLRQVPAELNQSEFGDADQPPQQSGYEPTFQPTRDFHSQPESYGTYSSDFSYSAPSQSMYDSVPFSSGLSESAPSAARDNISSQVPPFPDEETPKKRPVLYEELRSKNRENYEVTLTQKAETLLKPQADMAVPKKEVKKNKYGDAWEE
ncbi:OCIA domain-containing protein 1 [Chanos chanos]|uniref:OCIA domain-containing protein 1 n=1 Tax=Chanos chanos TaxID=29144 RepID=A0A6J2V5A1_CHACN|nr:OCIA domain-containing protein 1 [Chanos chanos]